jgi:hypothetical protein
MLFTDNRCNELLFIILNSAHPLPTIIYFFTTTYSPCPKKIANLREQCAVKW